MKITSLTLSAFMLTFLYSQCTSAQDNSTFLYKITDKEIAYPRLSADQQKILYQSNQDGNWQIWIWDRTSNTHTRITTNSYNNNFPDWSYDNQWIAYTCDRDGNEEIYLMRTDGSEPKRITQDYGRDIHPYFSPDGRYLLFNSTRGNGSFDIFRYTIATGELKQLSQTHENETCARYSPDMKHIVYLRNGATTDDVFMADSLNQQPVNVTNTPSTMDGWPVFSYDSKWIYFSSMETGPHCIYRIRIDGSEKTQLTRAGSNEEDARVAVSRDGKSIVFNRRQGGTLGLRELLIPS